MDFLFVGWQRIFSVKFWPVSSFLMAFLFLSTKVLVHPVVKVNISKININSFFVFFFLDWVLLFMWFLLF